MAKQLELTLHKICPFAHRAWLALEEAHAPFTLREVSLTEKPEWFTALYRSALGADVSSDGKVPVLKHGDFILTESAVVADYAVIAFGGESTIAPVTDAEHKARSTIFAEQQVSKLIRHWYGLLSAQEADVQASQTKDLLAAIAAISKAYEHYSGPYFLGDKLSLADVLVWPWIARLCVVQHYRGFSVPEGEEYKAYHKFVAAMKTRPAVTATQMSDEYYIDGYVIYANGSRVPK